MKKFQKALAVLLSAALLLQAVPLRAMAEEAVSSAAVQEAEKIALPTDFVEEKSLEAQVVYEETEQRSAAEKHFRLSDGSFVAASYPGPVHYETEDGAWEEIDNTLSLSQASRYSLGRINAPGMYEAKNGEETKRYSSVLRPDEPLFSLANQDYSFGLALLRPDTAQTLVTDKAVKPEEGTAEDSAESSSSSEPEETSEPSESSDASSMISEGESVSSQPERSELPGFDQDLNSEEEIQEESVSTFAEEKDFPVSSAPSSLEEKEETESSAPSAGQGAFDEETSLPSDAPESTAPEGSEPVASAPEEDSATELPPAESGKEETTAAAMAASVSAKIENPKGAKPGAALAPGNQINSVGVTDDTEAAPSLEDQLQPEKISSKVTYENVWPGVDLQYYNYGYNVKESIIVRQPQKSYRYSFLLNLEGLTPVLRESGSVDLLDENEKILYQIPAPYLVDAGQSVSYDAAYELVHTTEGYVLTVEAAAEWINAEDRQFPVTIDPTLILYGSDFGNSFTATCVTTEKPNTPGSGVESLYIGHRTTGDEMQVFFQFASLPTIPANCNVVNATLNLYQHTYSQVGLNRIFVQAHEVTSARPSSYGSNAEWIRNITWNTKPSFNRNITEAYARITEASEGKYISWDISRLVSKWYHDSAANCMLAMDAIGPDKFSATQCGTGIFWMNINSRPLFLIHYRNNVGLENRFTYQTSSVGRAGTANIGDYSAQLTLANTLFSSNSEAMPFSLAAYYNSPYRGRYFTANNGFGIHTANYGNMCVGSGWKLSVQETVVKITVKTNNASTDYYVYTDADGTEHYFEAPSSLSTYKDEDGLGYTLSVSGAVSTLKDEKNNQKEFYNGYLTKQTDRNGNAIYYLYNDNTAYSSSSPFSPSSTAWKPKSGQANRVTQVWQINDNGSAAGVQSLVCKLTYSGNFVNKITDASGRAYTFQYAAPASGAQLLSKITFPDGHSAQYGYSTDTDLLIKIYDEESKSGLELAYGSSFKNQYVHKAHEYIASTLNGTQTVGSTWHNYSPSLQQRLYRFYGQDRTENTNDDITTRYTFDLAGRTVNVVNYNSNWTEILGTSALTYTKNQGTNKTNNRVTGAAASGIAAVNQLQNGGLELGIYGWVRLVNTSGANSDVCENIEETSKVITPRTGECLMKMYIPSATVSATGEGETVSRAQTVYLEARTTYVFSGYANSSGITSFGKDGGMILSFRDSTGTTTLVESKVLDYATSTKIESGWTRLQVSFTPKTSGNYRIAASLRNASEYGAFDDLQLEKVITPFSNVQFEKIGVASSVNLVQFGSLEKWNSAGAFSTSISNYWTCPDSRVSPASEAQSRGRRHRRLT